MKTQRTKPEAGSPCLMFWRLRGSHFFFLCLCRMAFSALLAQIPDGLWLLGNSSIPKKTTSITLVSIPGHWPRESTGQRVRCPCHFKELKAEGSGGVLVAQGWLWNRKVAGSRVDIYMWSMEFAVTAPDRVLGSLLWPWLGAPELDPSLLGTTFHSPRGASSVQDCSHYP